MLAGQIQVRPGATEDESDLVTEVCWPVVRAVTPEEAQTPSRKALTSGPANEAP